MVGVRAWLAHGYGGVSQRFGVQAPSFCIVRFRTLSHLDIRLGLSRTPIRSSLVDHQDSSGPVGPYRLKLGFRPVFVGTLFWHDRPRRGLMGRSIVSYPCTTKIRTPQGPVGTRRGPGGWPGAPLDDVSYEPLSFGLL